jgi:WD40 repeat protein
MKIAAESFAGTALIAALVAAGVWFARDPECQQWPLSYLSSGPASGAASTFVSVNRFEWSTDGEQVLVMFRGEDGVEANLGLLDVRRSESSVPIDLAGETANAATLSRDGCRIFAGTLGGHLWCTEPAHPGTTTSLLDLPRGTFATVLATTRDGRLVGMGTNAGSLYLYNRIDQTTAVLTTDHQSAVRDLRFSRDEQQLVAAQINGRISVWDVAAATRLREFDGHDHGTSAADFLLDGQRIISVGLDDTVKIWDIASGQEQWRGEFAAYGITALALSPDGTTAAWAGCSRKIFLFDLKHLKKKFEITTPAPYILHLRFSPDGTALGAAGQEGVIRIYDVQTAAEKPCIEVVGPARP